MKWHTAAIGLSLLLFSCPVTAQEKIAREIEIHKNVKLIEMHMPAETPEEVRAEYQAFLPLFVETLQANTQEESPASALTFQIRLRVKEIGAAKTKRACIQITAFRRNSTSEYVGTLLLHSYSTGETVNKEEIEQFLNRQILNPLSTG